MIIIVTLAFVAYGVFSLIRAVVRRYEVRRFISLTFAECDRHSETLCLNYKRLVFLSEYDKYNFDAYIVHLTDFIHRNVLVRLSDWTRRFVTKQDVRQTAYLVISRLLAVHMEAYDNAIAEKANSPPSHHGDFERWCADNMTARGWQTRVTGKTGDQGADIVATKDGETLVVQCKRYSAPVGNKAVQEIVGAIAYYNADRGAVISTSGFTAAAQSLARVNGVLLIDAVSLAEHNESSIFN